MLIRDLIVINEPTPSDFTDVSIFARDYLRDSFTLTTSGTTYIGLYKPFDTIYIEFVTPSTGSDLTFRINGTEISVEDITLNYSRSGFIRWTKPDNWVAETVDGQEAFFLTVEDASTNSPVVQGLNIVFADDNDMRALVRQLDLLLDKNDISFIAYHVGARDEIVQTLRNGGRTKIEAETGDELVDDITKWDILEFGEIRNAAKYLALANIFFDASKNNDDKYYVKFRDYQGMYGNAFDLFILKIDQNDDGKYEQEDDLVFNSGIQVILG